VVRCLVLERGGGLVARRLALERGGGSPEGYHDRLFGGPLRIFGLWALLRSGPRPRGVRFVVCGVFVYFHYF
jgi:hypothetical protein